ncbi:DHA2 family efflux MFS transporter permease subunit [Comamonas badia]|uniref:DHA2 family efflux MFS transporter permease subunit n=1 Tax=Comamonas badia TaxID=265291 RepID=UPI0003F6D702|nr:DHA2 family efflux MFS transporter permease subunit [Comamonas badia]
MATSQAAGPELAPLSGSARAWGTLALSAATFMNVLDTSIANVSLPAIAGDLGVSPNQGTWVITSFAVANAISVPLTGWLAQRFGQVRLFVISVLLFLTASFLCGLAPSMPLLIAARVVQGFVAGPMIPLSQALLLSSYPRALAGLAMAMWSMTTLIAPVMGPLLGGWITDNISWPWIFYINIPVGIVAAIGTMAIYAERETATKKLPIDAMGLALMILGVGSLQIMLDIGKEHDWFSSSMVIGFAAAAVFGLIAFVIWELGEEHPIVDLSLFRIRNFWAGTIATAVGYGIFFGNVVLLPLWLQQYMGYTATSAGMLMAPVGFLAMVLSPIVGKSIGKVDPRRYATVAFFVFALVLWMRSLFATTADFSTIMIPTIIQGAAVAFFFVPLVTLTLSEIPAHRVPAASGLTNFVRITAGAVGTSVTTTLWERRATLAHANLIEHLHSGYGPLNDALQTLQSLGLTPAQALAQVERLVTQQAFTLAANDVNWASAVLFLLLVPLVWLADAPKRGAPGGSAAAAGAH